MGGDVRSLTEDHWLKEEEDYVSNIAQPVCKGHKAILKPSTRIQSKIKAFKTFGGH